MIHEMRLSVVVALGTFPIFLGSDNSHTNPPPPKMPPDEEGLLWGWCVVGGPLLSWWQGVFNVFTTLEKNGKELTQTVYNTVLDACVEIGSEKEHWLPPSFSLWSLSFKLLFLPCTAQILERGSFRMNLSTKFGKEIPSRNLRKKWSDLV